MERSGVVARRTDLHRRELQDDGNTRRAIDFHEGEKIDEQALKTLVRAAVNLNTSAAKS